MPSLSSALRILALAAIGAPAIAQAKPIAYANGTTVMGEYGAGTMNELQLFYAPRYFYSAGVGHLALQSDLDGRTRDTITMRSTAIA